MFEAGIKAFASAAATEQGPISRRADYHSTKEKIRLAPVQPNHGSVKAA